MVLYMVIFEDSGHGLVEAIFEDPGHGLGNI